MNVVDFINVILIIKKKDEITLINNFGSIVKYKFNRKKEKEKLKVVKTIQVIEEDLDEDFI